MGVEDPDGQMNPALHSAVHAAVVALAVPYLPGKHSPVHELLVMPVELPYRPAGQAEHTLAAWVLHRDGAHAHQ